MMSLATSNLIQLSLSFLIIQQFVGWENERHLPGVRIHYLFFVFGWQKISNHSNVAVIITESQLDSRRFWIPDQASYTMTTLMLLPVTYPITSKQIKLIWNHRHKRPSAPHKRPSTSPLNLFHCVRSWRITYDCMSSNFILLHPQTVN